MAPFDRTIAKIALLTLVFSAAFGAEHADARTPESLGGAAKQWVGADRCRGAKLRADTRTVLLDFEVALSNTAGVPLDYYVYEAATEHGTYALLDRFDAPKVGSLGSVFGWETSPPVYAQMEPGNYYVILVCWGKGRLVGYKGQPMVAPLDLGFGAYLGGIGYGASGTPPPGTTWSAATNDYLMRVHTSPGEAVLVDTERTYYGPFDPGRNGKAWGNIYRVDRQTRLRSFEQLFEVTTRSPDAVMSWYVYACARRSGCTKASASWAMIASGLVPVAAAPLNPKQWVGVDGLDLPLAAGRSYWIGFGWTDLQIRAYRFTAPQTTPSWGRFVAHALGSPVPLQDPQRFRAVFNAAHPQRLVTFTAASLGTPAASDTPAALPTPAALGTPDATGMLDAGPTP